MDSWKKALQNLPQHDPPEKVWNRIEEELQGEGDWQENIRKLPQYDPPEEVWQHIAGQLDAPARHRKLRRYRIPAAAMLTLLLGAALWLFLKPVSTEGNLVYSEEVWEEWPEVQVPNEDDEIFEIVSNYCREYKWACDLPTFLTLGQELRELNKARIKILRMMEQVAHDPDVIASYTEVERERTAVLKKMIELM